MYPPQLVLIHRTYDVSGKNPDSVQELYAVIVTVNLLYYKAVFIFLQAAGAVVKIVPNPYNAAPFLGRAAAELDLKLQGGGVVAFF